jgi:hypothetical protein
MIMIMFLELCKLHFKKYIFLKKIQNILSNTNFIGVELDLFSLRCVTQKGLVQDVFCNL